MRADLETLKRLTEAGGRRSISSRTVRCISSPPKVSASACDRPMMRGPAPPLPPRTIHWARDVAWWSSGSIPSAPATSSSVAPLWISLVRAAASSSGV